MKALKKLSKDERQYFAGYNMAEVKKQIGLQELAEDALALLKKQEEKQGRWLDVDDKHDAFDCSKCGAMVKRKSLYCPGCGTRMRNGTRATTNV